MRYEYYFGERYSDALITFLKENKIKYREGEFVTFSIWNNSDGFDRLLNELKEMRIEKTSVFAEYTKKELQNAEFLRMFPKRQFMDIINFEEAYRYSCKDVNYVRHKEQIGLFAIRKEPSSKTKTAFWAEDTGFSEVFADFRICEMVNVNELTGIELKNVIKKNGVVSENIFQMTSKNIIDRSWIGMGYEEKRQNCRICGKEQFVINDVYQLHLDSSKMDLNQDLYMTERIFGEGIAYPLYVISQRFYRLLRENNLDGGLNLSPVVLI